MAERDASFRKEDIEMVEKNVREKREAHEFRNLPERELVRETLRPFLQPSARQAPAQTGQVGQKREIQREDALPSYVKDADEETQARVEHLLSLVFSDGIEKAVREAERASPFSIDAFHDALIDKLYDELKKRGVL